MFYQATKLKTKNRQIRLQSLFTNPINVVNMFWWTHWYHRTHKSIIKSLKTGVLAKGGVREKSGKTSHMCARIKGLQTHQKGVDYTTIAINERSMHIKHTFGTII